MQQAPQRVHGARIEEALRCILKESKVHFQYKAKILTLTPSRQAPRAGCTR